MFQRIETMYGKNLVFWYCCAFLFVVSSSKQQQNLTNDNKKDDSTMLYELETNSVKNYTSIITTMRYNLDDNFTKDIHYDDIKYEYSTMSNLQNNDSMRNEFATHFIKNHKNDNNQILMESHQSTNSSEIDGKENFTSHEIYENWMKIEDKNGSTSHNFLNKFNTNNNKNNFVPYEMCNNITCIQVCCPRDDLIKEKCVAEENEYYFLNLYRYINNLLRKKNKKANELFRLIIRDPCDEIELSFSLDSYNNHIKYIVLVNGSLYFPYYKISIEPTFYCVTIVDENKFDITVCSKTIKKFMRKEISDPNNAASQLVYKIMIFWILRVVSMLFLLIIFLVYSILPELRNIHGFILRNYCALMFVAYIADIMNNPINSIFLEYPMCITIALICYFCYLGTCFWLTVMSFDMWWTFRSFRSLQRNIKQRERKKLIIYSLYVWGSPFILTVICIIMNFVPSVSKNLIQPKLGIFICWFNALKIARYEKDRTHHLKDSESRLYDEKKKWFKLYLKLFIIVFIVMGITWFMAILSWQFPSSIKWYLLYIVYSLDMMQNFGIFFIFVCKKTIKQQLLKRFSCQNCSVLRKTGQAVDVVDSTICSPTSETISFSKKINFFKHSYHTKICLIK
ncbi:G-protein coupled receptor Mth2-like isoform X2 [Nylanderia fulva]|uniref:G-protein coupled receptor Mth2-like isoform X2 n=1 Tax=Nylanderia fulva TaxID=613905 RepID=UPI0010FB34A8|nr:G-protein coupled receptor Mth2-like isoform X2 [Nylanderia fulva]